jgi:antitoxin (DNA-binding transcriptional repressor) of toxin-antitoxin stability system
VEHRHEQYVIVRRGRVIARLAPVAAATGADAKALLRRHSLDVAWGGEVAALREQLTAEERF